MVTEGGIMCCEKTVFSCCYTWQLRYHLIQEHGMKVNTEWKEFISETGSLPISSAIEVGFSVPKGSGKKAQKPGVLQN